MSSLTPVKDAFFKCSNFEEAEKLTSSCMNPDAMVGVHNSQGIYIKLSPSLMAFIGYTESELIDQSPYDFFHTDDFQKILKAHAEVTVTKEVSRVEYRLLKKDGSYKQVTTLSKTLKDENTEKFILTFTF
jgi:PAS domain S-box-containing protein